MPHISSDSSEMAKAMTISMDEDKLELDYGNAPSPDYTVHNFDIISA